MFYTRVHSPRIQIAVGNNQWYVSLYKLERTTSLLNNSVELRKLIPSATNIYNKYKTLDQREDILEAQKSLMLKISILENSNT